MRLQNCKLWTSEKEFAENMAKEYTEKEKTEYVVIFRDWLNYYIVTKKENIKYFENLSDDKKLELLWNDYISKHMNDVSGR